MVLAKKIGKKPKELAEDLKRAIEAKKISYLEKVEVAGPGFINFFLAKDFLKNSVTEIIKAGDDFGKNNLGQGRKAIVEYSSPNIAKEFSIGHLRSTIIGDAIANILSFSGYDVVRDNHLGDWGTQFGKEIVAIKKWGNEETIAKSESPVKELVALYVKFHEQAEKDPTLEDEARVWFAKLEQGDEEAVTLWKKCVDWSMVSFDEIYKLLGVKFDTALGESFFVDKTEEVYEALQKKDLMKKSEGAEVVFFEGDKLPPLIVRKTDGTSIYATRDLGADLYRKQTYGDDILVINETGSEQTLYFRQLFETEKMLGWYGEGKRVHVSHGLYTFGGAKMSTRKGNVIGLEEVINEAIKRSGEFNSAVAQDVGIGALKYNDLKRESSMNVSFDWNEALNLKGNSGPYLQYAYARTQSILNKSEKRPGDFESADEPGMVEKMLYRFTEVVERAARDYAPHHICTYLYDLAGAFSSYYEKNKIIGSEAEDYRLALTAAVGQVLKNGLTLLGIKTPEKI